ncbi:MAG TPA: HEAT repeat domain-containing protein [Caldilineae bacterium]|nr:HEAT repeat domain-containing protein [Caldilineae bacterium]
MTRKLTTLLNAIGDENEPIDIQALSNLSDLNAPELAQFQIAWRGYSATRQRELLTTLLDLAENWIEYDYRAIFTWTLEDDDPIVRTLSLEGLWEHEHPQLIPRLQRLLQQDEAVDVRAAAALALGRFVYLGETGDLADEHANEACQSLWDCFHNPSEHIHVRRRALEGIAASGQPNVTRLIENALYNGDETMRVSALYAMGRNADPRWVPFLLPELGHADAAIRLEAVRALGELEARPAVPRIIQLIAVETDSEVRIEALTALGQIGGDEARQALEAATEWDDEAIVFAAEAALEELSLDDVGVFELINEVLGIDDEFELDDDLYEDPLESELRQLLDARDEWWE